MTLPTFFFFQWRWHVTCDSMWGSPSHQQNVASKIDNGSKGGTKPAIHGYRQVETSKNGAHGE